jgi:thymidylate kinase
MSTAALDGSVVTDVLTAVRRVYPDATPEIISKVLVKNQIPLLSIEPVGTDEHLAVSPAWVAAVARDRTVFDESRGHYAELVALWESAGVQAMCFKSAGLSPSFPYTSENYDILIRAGDEVAARSALADLGYVELCNIEEPQKWLFRKFVAGRSVCAIHLHTRVGWGQGFMVDTDIWRYARLAPDDEHVWIPGPSDVALINVAHALYENKAFSLHDLIKIRHAFANGVDLEYLAFVARTRGWQAGLGFGLAMVSELEQRLFDQPCLHDEVWKHFAHPVAAKRRSQLVRAASGKLSLPFHTSFVLTKTLYFQKVWADQATTPSQKSSLTALGLVRGFKGQMRAHPQNSALITFSGLDGSGKTAQAQALISALTVAELRPRYMWARLGATPIMSRLSRLWRSDASGISAQRPNSRRSKLLPLWALLGTTDLAMWLLRVRWRLWRGDIVVADRYIVDFGVELGAKLEAYPKAARTLTKLVGAIAKKPQTAIYLRVDEVTANLRARPDGDRLDAGLVAQYDRTALARDAITVDATGSFESTSQEATRIAMRRYLDGYGTFLNLFYLSNPWQLNRKRKQPTAARTDRVAAEPVLSSRL